MNKIKVSYLENFSEEGTFYNQTVKVSKDLLTFINGEISKAKENKTHEFFFNNHDYIYLKELENGINFTTLTTARVVKDKLSRMNIDTKRFKTDRNTIIEII